MKNKVLLGIGVMIMAIFTGCSPTKAQPENQMQVTEPERQTEALKPTEEPGAESQLNAPKPENQIQSAKSEPQKGMAGTEAGEGAAYHKISPEEAKEMMDKEKVKILDVRTLQEYREGHIPEALNLPNEEIKEEEPELLGDKEIPLLIYCRSGIRSRDASNKLVDMGYTQVYDIGGIIDWPYETVKEE